jgi:hypothetical protein
MRRGISANPHYGANAARLGFVPPCLRSWKDRTVRGRPLDRLGRATALSGERKCAWKHGRNGGSRRFKSASLVQRSSALGFNSGGLDYLQSVLRLKL